MDVIIASVKVLVVRDFRVPHIDREVETCIPETREYILGWLHENAVHQHLKQNTSYGANCALCRFDFMIKKKQVGDKMQLQFFGRQ